MRNILVVMTLLASAGCVSEEKVEEDWAAYVEEHNACDTADDCAAISPGCPLGCYVAVSAEDVTAAEEEAARLIDRYERSGRACDYSCLETPPLVCEAGHCAFGDRPMPGGE